MARFDVYAVPGVSGFLLDCQSDILWQLDTRFVVPLLPYEISPPIVARLNPTFLVNDVSLVMVTQSAAAIRSRLLRAPLASLAEHQDVIMNAIDVLLTGY